MASTHDKRRYVILGGPGERVEFPAERWPSADVALAAAIAFGRLYRGEGYDRWRLAEADNGDVLDANLCAAPSRPWKLVNLGSIA